MITPVSVKSGCYAHSNLTSARRGCLAGVHVDTNAVYRAARKEHQDVCLSPRSEAWNTRLSRRLFAEIQGGAGNSICLCLCV